MASNPRRQSNVKVFLFAHENKGGGGIAQAQVPAKNYTEAREQWGERYGDRRTLLTTGELGKE